MEEDEWRVIVTADDLRCAREAWEAAEDSGAPIERRERLERDLRALWTLAAHQMKDDLDKRQGE